MKSVSDEEHFEREVNEIALRVARALLWDLKSVTGFTFDELPDDWLETVRWRDTGMTFEKLEEFLLADDEPPGFRRHQ